MYVSPFVHLMSVTNDLSSVTCHSPFPFVKCIPRYLSILFFYATGGGGLSLSLSFTLHFPIVICQFIEVKFFLCIDLVSYNLAKVSY